MFNWGKKQGEKKNYKPPEEYILELKATYEKQVNELEANFAINYRSVEENYLKEIEERKKEETSVPFETVIFEAEKEQHPLVYEKIKSNPYATEYIFSRGKFTLNPYKIVVNHYVNCLFLHVYKSPEKKSFITLYFDKVTNVYSENKWEFISDYLVKTQIRSFLYDVLKDVFENTLHTKNRYISEFQAKKNFFEELGQIEKKLKDEYLNEITLLEEEKREKLSSLKRTLFLSLEPFEKEIKKREASASVNQEYGKLSHEKKVHDEAVSAEMKIVFHRARDLYNMRAVLDSFSKHTVESLYEKDLHELWFGYVHLDKTKQIEQKERFLDLLKSIHLELNTIDKKIKSNDEFDFETKMKFMEQKFKSV